MDMMHAKTQKRLRGSKSLTWVLFLERQFVRFYYIGMRRLPCAFVLPGSSASGSTLRYIVPHIRSLLPNMRAEEKMASTPIAGRVSPASKNQTGREMSCTSKSQPDRLVTVFRFADTMWLRLPCL